MKRYVIRLLLLTLGSWLVACQDILEQDPPSTRTIENFYRNEGEAVLAVNGIYDELGSIRLYNRGQVALGLMEDHTYHPINISEFNAVADFNILPANPLIFNWYRGCYIGIARANFALDRIPQIETGKISETVRKRSLGESKFLRGLYYTHLVRLFGEVPLITIPTDEPEAKGVAKSREADIWAQIEKDFAEAAADLPATHTGNNVGRATSGAAKIFLAQAYQWQGKHAQALTLVKEVIDSKLYSLHPEYVDNFLQRNDNGRESVFAVQFHDFGIVGSTNEAASWVKDIGVRGTNNRINSATGQPGNGYLYATNRKLADYEAGDIRRNVTMWENGKASPATGQTFNPRATDALGRNQDDVAPMKWWWNDQGYTGTGSNLDLIRYADVLLMHAELVNEVNGPTADAYASINAVRQRAKLANLSPNLSKTEFFQAVLKERHVELMFEFQRWWDLARTKTAPAAFQNAAGKQTFNPAKHYKWPLPSIALERNQSLVQNPAYL